LVSALVRGLGGLECLSDMVMGYARLKEEDDTKLRYGSGVWLAAQLALTAV
jgi:hypothetical protein